MLHYNFINRRGNGEGEGFDCVVSHQEFVFLSFFVLLLSTNCREKKYLSCRFGVVLFESNFYTLFLLFFTKKKFIEKAFPPP